MKRDTQTRVFRGNGNDEFSQENILYMIRRCYLADNEVWTPISRDERRFRRVSYLIFNSQWKLTESSL